MEKKPTTVLESIADAELWILGCHFCKHGSLNDINILDASPVVTKILQCTILLTYEYSVNQNILQPLLSR